MGCGRSLGVARRLLALVGRSFPPSGRWTESIGTKRASAASPGIAAPDTTTVDEVSMNSRLLGSIGAVAALSAAGLVAVPAQAANFGDMMNPGKWFGGNRDYDRDYYRYPGYGYGYPGYGYGYPGYGYGYPGYGYGNPGYGYGYPGQGAGNSNQPAPAPTPQ